MEKLNLKSLATAICLLFSIGVSAYDFTVDGLCYNITSKEDRTVEVTYYFSDNNQSYVKGDLIIPERFLYNGKTYKVTSIGDRAFYDCSGLTSVEIPNSVTSIGRSAFSDCSGLTSVEIPNSVTSIGEYAFSYCSGLTSVTIGNSVTSIGDYAFRGCSGLTSVEIPNSVTSIGYGAFWNCRSLTSVEIPNSVTSIGYEAFSGCSGLTSVEIPNSVTSIGYEAFSGCSGLTSVEIPNSVTSIGDEAFSGCSGLTSVEIPNSVTSIGEYAFSYCSGLMEIKVADDNQNYVSIDGCLYSKDVTTLCCCPGAKTSITIPNSVTLIGDEAFGGCSGLTNIEIPNSVTSIGVRAFYDCSGLTSLTLGSSVTSIGEYAFSGCDGLKEVYCKMETPVETEATFRDDVYMNAVLYVPEGCKEAYEKVDPWRNFWTIEEFDPTGISSVIVNGGQFVTVDGGTIKVDNADGQTVNVYTVGGQCVYSGTDSTISNLAKGVYVVKSGDNVAKIFLK